MLKEPNYQLMAYVNELVLENQQLKQLTTEQRGTATTAEVGTDMSQDAAEIVDTRTTGTQTQAAMVDVTVPAYARADGNGTQAADANLLLEQLQQQLEGQLAREQHAAATELQMAEAEQALIAAEAEAEAERDSVAAKLVSTITNEVLSESACCAMHADATAESSLLGKGDHAYSEMEDEDPYTSPEDDYEESSEEDQQERSVEGVAEHYGQLLSGDSSCVSPGQSTAPMVAPTPPAQDTHIQGLAGSLQSPPVSVPRPPAVERTADVRQKQFDVTGTGMLA